MQSAGGGISIAGNLRSLKMDHMADQERQSDYYGEIEGNNILGLSKKSKSINRKGR
jgi:hypothetical protein